MNRSGIGANESLAHRSSGALPLNYLQRYGLAILSVGVALGASLLLDHFHFRVPSALLLLFAVAISSWYAGAGPAVLAAILSTISFYWYFVEPVHTIYIYRSEIPYFVIFTAFAALLSRFGTFRQRAEADLRRTHDQLKVERPKLGSRTIALLYFAFSSCWILFTDRLVHGLGLSNAYLLKVSEAKGILFISLSTLLMYVLVEKALRQRHSVATAYWQLVETAQEGVWSVDAEGKTVFANENMAAILGTSPGEMIGKSILPFAPQEKKDELLNHLLQREQGLQEHYEFPFLRADGAQVWTLLRVSPVLRDGQHSGCLALVSDITKRKHAEETLRRLNRELRALSNCNQALLRATDEQSLLEEICRIVCEEAGYRMAWVAYAEHDEAKSVRPVAWTGAEEGYLATAGITWADTERGRSPTGTAIRSGKTCCIEDFTTDPRLAPWRESVLQHGFLSGIALPLKDENDNAFGSLTIHSAQPNAFTPEEVRLLEGLAGDMAFGIVTLRSRAARKQAEQALRQSEAYLAEAQRLSHTGSWALDVASGNYVYCSEEYLRIYGYDPQGGLPPSEAVLQRIHPEDWNRWKQKFEETIREKIDTVDEYRIVLPDGTMKHIQIMRHPVLNSVGDVVQLSGTAIDITERKRAEEALLEERVRERTRIARELHDTLLQSFHGLLFKFQAASNLFSRRPDDAKQILDGAIDEADQALTEGRDAIQGLRSSPVETNDLDAAIRTLGEELAADQSNHSSAVFQAAVVGTPQELSPRLRDEVYGIAAEALRNAFRHAEARQIEVEIRYDEPQFRLRVRDDGRGIDPKVLAEEGRAGHWGLRGMRERAKLVGGKLRVRSELASGTEIELSIPASAAYDASPRRSRLSAKSSGKGTDVGEAETKMKS